LAPYRGTRSSLAGRDKRRFGCEILKVCRPGESNQKRGRVNRIQWLRHSGFGAEPCHRAGQKAGSVGIALE
jgi:hypothetical protein